MYDVIRKLVVSACKELTEILVGRFFVHHIMVNQITYVEQAIDALCNVSMSILWNWAHIAEKYENKLTKHWTQNNKVATCQLRMDFFSLLIFCFAFRFLFEWTYPIASCDMACHSYFWTRNHALRIMYLCVYYRVFIPIGWEYI